MCLSPAPPPLPLSSPLSLSQYIARYTKPSDVPAERILDVIARCVCVCARACVCMCVRAVGERACMSVLCVCVCVRGKVCSSVCNKLQHTDTCNHIATPELVNAHRTHIANTSRTHIANTHRKHASHTHTDTCNIAATPGLASAWVHSVWLAGRWSTSSLRVRRM